MNLFIISIITAILVIGLIVWQEYRIGKLERDIKGLASTTHHSAKIATNDYLHLGKRLNAVQARDQERMERHVENYHPDINIGTVSDEDFYEALDNLEPKEDE